MGIEVRQWTQSEGVLEVKVHCAKFADPAVKKSVIRLVDRLLGVKIDLTDFYASFDRDPKIGTLIREFKGVKPPRFPTMFEALVNAFACQQVSLNVGLLLLNRMATAYGSSIDVGGQKIFAFPSVHKLAKLHIGDLRNLGFSSRKSEYVIETAKLVSDQTVDLEDVARMDNTDAIDFLKQLKGVGRWTAEYALLRGAGRLDIFPADDVGGQNGLRNLLRLNKKLDYYDVNRIISKWQPYAGLLYFHLLLRRIKKNGWI